MNIASLRRSQQTGFTLVELMISVVIGLLIVLALITLLVNVNRSNNEMTKTNLLIENGRLAVQLLQRDIELAGYWGDLDYTIAPTPAFATPTAVPDACLAPASWDDNYKANMLSIPVDGFNSSSIPTSCTTSPAVISGVLSTSDVLVVRHSNNCLAGSADCDGGTDTGPHIQVSNCRIGAPPEAAYVIAAIPASAASATTVFPLREKVCPTTTTYAGLRKVVTNIYYVANSNNLPTLMRVSIANGAFSTPQPLIEGIEAFRVEYGIDSDGNGSSDSYVTCTPCTLAQLKDVVAVKIHVLARNLEVTPGYTDSKTYQLGASSAISAVSNSLNANVKRHVFSTTIRLVNPSGRREVAP